MRLSGDDEMYFDTWSTLLSLGIATLQPSGEGANGEVGIELWVRRLIEYSAYVQNRMNTATG